MASEKNESATLQRHDGPRGALAPRDGKIRDPGNELGEMSRRGSKVR